MKEENIVKVSVIMPVYNALKYIEKSVDSILCQSLKSLELILVDDGSTDGSGAWCDKLAQEENRVKVFHKQNGGASSARNVGLENATGEYVSMLDSDDWLDFDCLKTCVVIAEKEDIDFIDFGYRYINSHGYVRAQPRNVETPVLSISDYANNKHTIFKGTWGTFYRREAIGKIRFNETLISNEDCLFHIEVASQCRRLKEIPNVFYNVYSHDNSVTTSPKYYRLQFDAWDVFNEKSSKYPLEKRWFDEHALIVANDSIRNKVASLKEIRKRYKESEVDVDNIHYGNRVYARLAKLNFYVYAAAYIVVQNAKDIVRRFVNFGR